MAKIKGKVHQTQNISSSLEHSTNLKRPDGLRHLASNESGSRRDKFGRGERMVTDAKAQALVQRHREDGTYDAQKLASSHQAIDETEVRIIVSDYGECHGLNYVLDSLREDKEIFVCKLEPYVIQIVGRSRAALKKASAQLHSRLACLNATTSYKRVQFLVQPPHKKFDKDLPIIHCQKQGRPHIPLANLQDNLFSDASKAQTEQLMQDFPSAAAVLTVSDIPLRLRINFGKLSLNRGLDDNATTISYPGLATMLKKGSIKQGAAFETRLSDWETIINSVKAFVDPEMGFSESINSIRQRFELTLRLDQLTCVAEAESLIGKVPRLSASQCYSSSSEPLLNWVVAVPDLSLDWNIEISSIPPLQPLPEDVHHFIQKIEVVPQGGPDPVDFLSTPPTWRGNMSTNIGQQIEQIKLKHSILIPICGFPYTLEVGITQQWSENWTEQAERSWVGLELFGRNWDEGINKKTSDGQRKDWGQDFSHIFPSSSLSLEDGLDEFVRTIYQVLYLSDCNIT